MGASAFLIVTLAAASQVLLISKTLHLHAALQNFNLASIIAPVFVVNYSLFLFYNMAIYPIFVDPLRKVPGHKYGHYFALKVMYHQATNKKIPVQSYAEMVLRTPNNGIVALRSFGSTALLLTDPGLISAVLVDQRQDYMKPPNLRKFLSAIIGDGLVLAEGEEHKFLRKNTKPAFSPRHIKDLYPMIWNNGRALTDALAKNIKQGKDGAEKDGITGTVDMCYWGTRVSLDIIGRAGLGHEFNSLKNSDDQLSNDYAELMEPSVGKVLWFFVNAQIPYRVVQMLPWRLNRLMGERISSVRAISEQLVVNKRKAMEKNGEGHFDILSLLIKSNNFSQAQLADQLLTFLMAGHETTSSTFIWACYLLSINPDMQAILRAEVRDALSGIEPPDMSSVMESMPYLNGVILEAIRLYPTAPVLLRVAKVDTLLLDTMVPEGTTMVIAPWLINRSPEFWGSDADEFRPARWIGADRKPNHTGGGKTPILSFLHGLMGCIGENFSKAELRCLIAAMVSRFELELDMPKEKVVPGGAVTIRPVFGLHVKLKLVD